MMDQAQSLRELVNKVKQKNNIDGKILPQKGKVITLMSDNIDVNESKPDNLETTKKARVIAVTSGKGGVGKTNLAVNLAVALKQAGFKTVVLDADFGLANIEVVLGSIPKYNLLDVIKNNKTLPEIISNGTDNLSYISCGSGVEELTRLSSDELNILIKSMSYLDQLYDFVIVDTGAGISENVLSMVIAADEVIVVTTPEPTSITDAYAMIKMIAQRDKSKNVKILVNRAESEREASQIFRNLKEVTGKYVGTNIDSIGHLISDDAVGKAVRLQQPFLVSYPRSAASKMIREISKKMFVYDEFGKKDTLNAGVTNFINRFIKYISS